MLEGLLLTGVLYVEEINKVGEASRLCSTIEDGGIIIMDSNGGIVDEFLELGDCVYDKKLNIILLKAQSAAAYTISAAEKTCIYEDSLLSYHSTHHKMQGEIVELSLGQLRQSISKITSRMQRWGVDEQKIININYIAMMTPPQVLFKVEGEDIAQFTNKVAWCNDLIEESDVGKDEE